MSNTLKIPLTYSTNVTGEENRTREREGGGESDQILNTFKELSVYILRNITTYIARFQCVEN